MRNARLDELPARFTIARRKINNLWYVDYTILMAESEEEVQEPLDEGEGGERKSWLKTQY